MKRIAPFLHLAVLAMAVVLLIRVFRSADLDRVIDLVRGSGPWIGLVLLPFVVAISIDTLGWKVILGSLRRVVRFRRLLPVRFASEALLLSVPMGAVAAESLNAYLLEKRCGVPAPEGVSSIAAKKNLLMFSLAAFLVTSALFGYRYLADGSYRLLRVEGLPWIILAGATGLALIASLMSLLLVHGSMAERLHRLLLAIPVGVVRVWLLRRERRFREVDQSFTPIARARHRLIASGILFYFGFLVETIESYLILRVIGADIGFVQVLAFDATATLIRSAIIVVPAGIGFQDAGYLAFFRAFAIPEATDVVAAFLLVKRAKEAVWIAFGYVMLAIMRRRHRGNLLSA